VFRGPLPPLLRPWPSSYWALCRGSIDGSRDRSIALEGNPCRRRGRKSAGGAGGPWGLWRHLTDLGGQASDTFSTRPPGPTTASHCTSRLQLRVSALAHPQRPQGWDCDTLGKWGVGSSRRGGRSPPGRTAVVPGQCVADFSDRRRSARRSDSRRSRSVAPWSTKVMASARTRWPATSAIALCICWATLRYAG